MLKGQSSYPYVRDDVRQFAAAAVNAGGFLSQSSQLAVNRFLTQLKDTGLYAKTKDCGLLIGSNVSVALLKLIGSGQLVNNGLFLTYSESGGLQGNAANSGRIETNFIPTSNGLSVNDSTIAVYSLSNTWTGVVFGSGNSSTINGNFYIGYGDAGGSSLAGGANPAHPNSVALKTISSSNAAYTYTRYFQEGTAAFGSLTGTVDPPNTALVLLNQYYGAYFPCNAIIGGYWAGNALSQIEIGKLSSIFDQLNFDINRKIGLGAVFFGDSITSGIGASIITNRWSSLVASSLGIFESNKGISGTVLQHTAPTQINNGRDRYISDVYNQRGWKVFVLYGINDFRYNNSNYTVATFQNDLNEIVQGLINGGTAAKDIVLGTTPYMNPDFYTYAPYAPFNNGSLSRHQAHNDAVMAIASTNGTAYADIYRAMLNGGANNLITSDGVHPNDAGHALIANTFLAAL